MRRLPWFVIALVLVGAYASAQSSPVISIKPKAFSASTPVAQSQVTGLTSALAGKASTGANSTITSLTGLTTPLSIAQGGTAATTAATARTALGTAASGANSDITSLTSLSTPLSIGQGGTGSTTVSGARTALGLTATTCTLNGGATPTCTATVPTGSICTCSYSSSTLPHIVTCALVSTTLTALGATTLDAGVVNITCVGP